MTAADGAMTVSQQFQRLCDEYIEHSTIGYWIGLLSPTARVESGAALAMASAMAFQYDIEEQAHRTGYVFPRDADWRQDFEPIAPIQLTNGWQPIEPAIGRLGSPAFADVAADAEVRRVAAVLAWPGEQIGDAVPRRERIAVGDPRRFSGLADVALMRAKKRGRGVLLVVRPGWSYDNALAPSEALRAAWSRAGFAALDRRPAGASGPDALGGA